MKFQHLKRWQLTAINAPGLAQKNFLTREWEVFGIGKTQCESPIYREYIGAESLGSIWNSAKSQRGAQMTIEFWVRCRQCLPCRKARAYHWQMRSALEIYQAPRTWFGTFTFRPEEQYRIQCQVDRRLVETGRSWAEESDASRFRMLATEGAKDITRYWKRLRKAGASFKYVLVAEAHKSGLPHYHALIHELSEIHPVPHSLLVEKWWSGFSTFKLCDAKASSYVTKYLTKSARARIWASARYGKFSNLT